MRTRLLLACLLVVGFGESLLAQIVYAVDDIPTVAEMNGFVFDPGGELAGAGPELSALLNALDEETTAQGGVFVLPSIGAAVPKDFAVELFERQQLGYAGTDFGFLVLLVLDQRRAEIETGYGLEGYLTDLQAKRLLDREFVPRMQAGQTGPAVLALVRGIDGVTRAGLRGETTEPAYVAPRRAQQAPERAASGLPGWLLVYLTLNGLFHAVLGGWLLFVHKDKISLYDKYVRVKRGYSWFYAVLFPLPYVLIRPFIGRWLKRLRCAPRFHPETKEAMTMLSEYDEIPFLNQGSLTEQEVESAEWDVWATPSRKHVQLLRYGAWWTAYERCPECQYQTYKLEHTKIIKAATYSSGGSKLETSRCRSCAYEREELKRIPQKQRNSGGGGSSFSGGGGGSRSGGGGSSGGGGAGASW